MINIPLSEEQKNLIVEWYSEGLSTRKIAEQLGISSEGVRYTLQIRGIQRRNVSEAFSMLGKLGMVGTNKRYLSEEQKSQVCEMYSLGYSTTQIGEYFSVASRTVSLILDKRGIKLRSISEARVIRCRDLETKKRSSESHKKKWSDPEYREMMIESLNKNKTAFTCDDYQMTRLKGIIAGMMLGDGGLHIKKGGRHAILGITHTTKQKPYLEYKAGMLNIVNDVHITESKPSGKNKNMQYQCRTRTNPFYTEIYHLIYPEGKKKVSIEWIQWLTDEGLAIWYMDDGCLNKKKSNNKNGKYRVYDRSVNFATHGFSYEENVLLQNIMKDRFDLDFTIRKSNKYYYLKATAKEASKLFNIIGSYMVPCMRYKIDME